MEDETSKDEDIIIDDQTDKVYTCIPLSLLSYGYILLTYLENAFFQIKNMSNTMCNVLSIHVVDMHSCTGISLQWD